MKEEKQLSNSYWLETTVDDSPFPPPDRLKSTNLGMLYFEQAEEIKHKCFAAFRDRADDQWATISWEEATHHVLKLLRTLSSSFHIRAAERTVIISSNGWEALLCDIAAVCSGAAVVHAPPGITPAQVSSLMQQAAPTVICLEGSAQAATLNEALQQAAAAPWAKEIKGIIYFDALTDISSGFTQAASMSISGILLPAEKFSAEAIVQAKNNAGRIPSAAAAAIYFPMLTQDTEPASPGDKEAMMQTHANCLAMLDALLLSALLGPGDNIYLGHSLSCAFTRACAYAAIALGGSLIFPTALAGAPGTHPAPALLLRRFRRDMRDSHPAVVLTDNTLLAELCRTVTNQPKRLLQWSLAERKKLRFPKAPANQSALERLRQELAQAVLSKLRSSWLGLRIQHILASGPPIVADETLEFFEALHTPVLQGIWGREASGAVCSNTSRWKRRGSLGRLFDGIAAHTAPTGELYVRGSAVCGPAGEWRAAGVTAALDSDGYLWLNGPVAKCSSCCE